MNATPEIVTLGDARTIADVPRGLAYFSKHVTDRR